MKKTLLIFTALASMISVSCSNNDQNKEGTTDSTQVATTENGIPQGSRYGIKSGIVTYAPYEMMGIKVTQTTYFDDYGKKEAQEILSEGEMMGIKTKSHSMNILADGYSISYELENTVNGKDNAKKVAKKMKVTGNPFGSLDLSSFTEEVKKNYDYKEEGTETVAGVEGTKFSMTLNKDKADSRITGVLYKNIMLKSEMKMANMKISLLASKFEQNATIPAEKFGIPAGYTVEEVNMNAPIGSPN